MHLLLAPDRHAALLSVEAAFPASLPVLAYHPEGGDRPPLLPLLLSMECCASQQEMNGNVEATVNRGYTRLNEYLDAFPGVVSICGSGPSLADTYQDMQGDVFAINNALKFLLEHGVVPKFAMFWDAAECVEQFAIPHPEITYLVGARCHPKVFERLRDCKIIVWHAGGDHNIKEFLEARQINEPMVNGGSAGVTRALYLAYAIGKREFHLYGADSSYSDDGKTHVNESLVPEKDFQVWIGNHDGNKPFRTTPEWCAQIEEYKSIYPMFKLAIGVNIEVHGTGMLPHMHKILVEKYRNARYVEQPEQPTSYQGDIYANAGK